MRLALALLAAAALGGCGGGDDPQPRATPAAQDPGLAVFTANGCGSCHTLEAADSSATIGPNLDSQLAGRDARSIRAAIVSPPSGSIMPEDFGTRLTPKELDQLAAFLDRVTG